MKKIGLIFLPVIFIISSCTHETKIMEETYPDGSPKRECVYKGNGESREMVSETRWYPNKKIQLTGEYKDRKRDGKWVYYYENGNVWSEGFFKDGKSDGKRVTHYENGKIFYEGYYQLDKKAGLWKFYNENGNFVKSIDYSKQPGKSK